MIGKNSVFPRRLARRTPTDVLVRLLLIRASVYAPLLFATLAFAAAPATSTETPVGNGQPQRAMTLDEALAYARQYQPSLQAALARLQAAQTATGVPRGLWYPRFAATAQIVAGSADNTTASYFGVPGVDLPRIGATRADTGSWQPFASTLAAVGARQEIFDFGRIAALAAVADTQFQAERGRADVVRLDVAYAVKEAFFAVQAARGVLTAARSALERSRVNRDTAAAGVRAGLRSPIELTRAEAEYARFEVGTVRAQAGLAAAQSAFAAVVGVPELTLDVSGEAPPIQATPPLAQALAGALDRDPAIHVGRARLAEQRAQTHAIATELRPDLLASATFSAREGGAPSSSGGPDRSGWAPETPNWDIGLIFSWPIYDRTVRERESVSAQLEHARQSELRDLEERLQAFVQQAYVDFNSATQALPALQKAVQAGKANYDQALARFQAGLGTSVELADAQDVLAAAEIQLALGQFDSARARARLGRVIAEEP